MNGEKYYLCSGTVQAIVRRDSPFFSFHFGRAEYLKEKPVISESIRDQAQPIIDALNVGTIDEEQAKSLLAKIWY